MTVVIATAVVLTPTQADFFAAFMDKCRLLEKTPSPRIVFIGGSGTAFGVDSERIERAFGMPVINTGLHAGLGLRFMLEHALPYIRARDLVVLMPEYTILGDAHFDDDSLATAAYLSQFPASLREMSLREIPALLRGFPDFALHKVIVDKLLLYAQRHGRPGYVYKRAGFDAHGDEVGHLTEPSPASVSFHQRLSADVLNHVEMMNEFAGQASSRGADVVLLYPTLARTSFIESERTIQKLSEAMVKSLRVPRLGDPAGAVQPDADFFDTSNHLNARGRQVNTDRIIELLASLPRFATNPAPSLQTPR